MEDWPANLKAATALLLHSPVPIVMLWGEDGVMIYNDAYSEFAGYRHPELFGSKVREGWSEIAAFNDNVMKVGLSGKSLAYRDQELTGLSNNDPAVTRCFLNIAAPCAMLLMANREMLRQVLPSLEQCDPATLERHLVQFALGGFSAVAASPR